MAAALRSRLLFSWRATVVKPWRLTPLVSGGTIRRMGCLVAKRWATASVLLTTSLLPLGVILALLSEPLLRLLNLAEVRWYTLLLGSYVAVAVWLIWRERLRWTGRRRAVWLLVSAILFVEPAIGKPLWKSQGCFNLFSDEATQQVSLEFIAIGLAGLVFASLISRWLAGRRASSLDSHGSTREMAVTTASTTTSRTVCALLVSIALHPLGLGVFVLTVAILDRFFGNVGSLGFLIAPFATAFLVCAPIWARAWMGAFPFAQRVRRRFLWFGVIALVGPLLVVIVADVAGVVSSSRGELVGALPLFGWCAWIWATAWMVRQQRFGAEGREESATAPPCPSCGYLLAGLTSTRCPECGSEPTLDELWAAHSSPI